MVVDGGSAGEVEVWGERVLTRGTDLYQPAERRVLVTIGRLEHHFDYLELKGVDDGALMTKCLIYAVLALIESQVPLLPFTPAPVT